MPTKYQPDKLYELDVESIVIADQKLRRDPNDEEVIELGASIIEDGLLEPIGFRLTDDGQPELLYGGRRLAAHKRIKKKTILAIFKPRTDDQVKSTALIENLQRQPLTLAEEIDAITDLHERKNLSPQQISVRLSKSRDWVLRRLAIPQLPEDLKGPLLEGRLSLGSAEELSRLEVESIRRYATQQVFNSDMGISQVRDLVTALEAVEPQEDAIQQGVEKAKARSERGTPQLSCQACGAMRDLPDLMVVRICKPQCPAPQTEKQTNGVATNEGD